MPLEVLLIGGIVFSYSKYKESSDYTIISHQLPYKENQFYLQERGYDFRIFILDFLGKTDSNY
jgi:hypothetical protein